MRVGSVLLHRKWRDSTVGLQESEHYLHLVQGWKIQPLSVKLHKLLGKCEVDPI